MGTYKVSLVDSPMDLRNPVLQIPLLVLHLSAKVALIDCSVDPEHTSSRPSVACSPIA